MNKYQKLGKKVGAKKEVKKSSGEKKTAGKPQSLREAFKSRRRRIDEAAGY